MKQVAAVAAVLFVLVPCAAAQMGGGAGVPMHGGGTAAQMPRGGLVDVFVAPDGTVLSFAPVSTPALAVQITAISPAGTKIWTYSSASTPHHFTFDGVLAVFAGGEVVLPSAPRPYRPVFELVALNLVTGAVAWKLPIDGFAAAVQSGGGQFYVVALMNTGERKLIAVNTSGAILWTQTL